MAFENLNFISSLCQFKNYYALRYILLKANYGNAREVTLPK
jgi:hypothetical protein